MAKTDGDGTGQIGGESKYDASGAKTVKNGGNDAKHDGIVSGGEKYPTPNATGKGITE